MISPTTRRTIGASFTAVILLLSLWFSTGFTVALAQDSEAELYDPVGVTLLETTLNVVPDAKEGIENVEALPNDTEFKWDDEEIFNELTDLIKGKIIITYRDDSVDEVEVNVQVSETESAMEDVVTITATDADIYNPFGGDVGLLVEVGVVPDPIDGVVNFEEMPEGTLYAWEGTEVFETVMASTSENVIVTYPDGSKDTVVVPLSVVEEVSPETDAELYQPRVIDLISTEIGVVPSAREAIINLDELPEGTQYRWQDDNVFDEIKTEINENLIAQYPDGTEDMVPVLVTVTEIGGPEETDADVHHPEVVELLTTTIGVVPQARDAVTNQDELPEGTMFRWQDDIVFDEVKTEINENLIAQYPDGSEDMVPVLVTVTEEDETDADRYAPRATELITTEVGVVPEAIDGITNFEEMPVGTLYVWENESVFDQVAEATHGYVVVTYPDSSREVVPVPVKVVEDLTPEPDADLYNPIAVPLLTTDVGIVPPARDGIENLNELPTTAVFSWDSESIFQTVTTSTQAIVIITYEDGSTDRIPVTVMVKEISQQTSANLTIRFVDLNGNQIMSSRIMSRPIGTTYQVNRVTIEGYVLDSVIGNEKGIVSSVERANIITYVYRKVPNVVKESGNPEQQLPATGESSNWFITVFAVVLILSGGGILYTRYTKKE